MLVFVAVVVLEFYFLCPCSLLYLITQFYNFLILFYFRLISKTYHPLIPSFFSLTFIPFTLSAEGHFGV